MGICSTRTITRRECIEEILRYENDEREKELESLSNSELEDIMDRISDDIFSNYLIKDKKENRA